MGNAKMIIGATGGQIDMSESVAVAGASGFGMIYVSSADKQLHLVNSDGVDSAVGAGGGELQPGDAADSLYTPNVGAIAPPVGNINAIAIGNGAKTGYVNTPADGEVAIGKNAKCERGNAISIGRDSGASEGGISMGQNSLSSYGSVAVGISATTYWSQQVAIGNATTSSHNESAVLGANLVSVADFTAHVNGLNVKTVGDYADNAAAVTAGLVVGQVYRTGDLMKIVHA